MGRVGVRLVSFSPASFSASWVKAQARRFAAVHLNWLHAFYAGATRAERARRARAFLEAVDAARRSGLRVVWTMHNTRPHETIDARLDETVRRRVATDADAVTVHCRAGVRILAERYRRRHSVHVVPRGSFIGVYRDEVDRTAARLRLGLPEGAFVYLFFGALRPYKGLDGLVRAFAKLTGPRLRLVIAGFLATRFPSLLSRLQKAALRDPRIRLQLGAVPADEIQYLMKAADAVVLPFARILNSASVLVPLGFGRAVVAPRLGCLPEIVGPSAGVLYDPGRPDALRRALVRVRAVSHPAGLAARRRARSFTWERTAERMLRAYGLPPPPRS